MKYVNDEYDDIAGDNVNYPGSQAKFAEFNKRMEQHATDLGMSAFDQAYPGTDSGLRSIQEGMIGLFKAVRDFDLEKESSFAAFAQLCISRQLYSALQASNRKKHRPLNTYVSFSMEDQEGQSVLEETFTHKTSNPEEWILEQEKLEEFQKNLKECLSTMEQQVLGLYLEGHNYIRISEILEKSPKSIDNALQRIRQKIRQLQE